ncbi:MAG: succinylglutamate desuccinylase/aspartoacylase family protein [Prevotella sp.]
MKKEILFEMKSSYRGSFNIQGYWFGEGEKTVAIVGAMRGDEIQQQYICARIVAMLADIERRGGIIDGKSILVVPSCNPFSMNVSRRFWAMDGTDINRMFPGYDKGETTQRIAAALFEDIKDFKYGMQLASFYMPGDFVPHVRMLSTGYEDVDTAMLFGMPFVTTRRPLPFDTTLLNYNWQIWGTKAFSIYAGQTSHIDLDTSQQTIDSILRFLTKAQVIDYRMQNAGYESVVFDESELTNVKAQRAGIFYRIASIGQRVSEGDVLARILDPYDCHVLQEVAAPRQGTIFFAHSRPLTLEHSILFKLLCS